MSYSSLRVSSSNFLQLKVIFQLVGTGHTEAVRHLVFQVVTTTLPVVLPD